MNQVVIEETSFEEVLSEIEEMCIRDRRKTGSENVCWESFY